MRHPFLGLTLALSLTGLLAIPAASVEHRYEIEDFFPAGTPERLTYDDMRTQFGRDDRTALLVLELDRPLDAFALSEIDAVTTRLERRADLERVLSPANALIPVRRPDGNVVLERAVPLASTPGPARVERLLETFALPPYLSALVSADHRLAVIGAVLREDHLDFDARAALLADMEAERDGLAAGGFKGRLAGYPLQRVRLARLAASESRRFLPLTLAVILILSALAFRSVAAVVLPLLVAACAAVWTTGLMGLLGLPPNIFGPAVYVMVTVVGVADSVHLLSRHRELRSEGLPAGPAVALSLREVGPPCFWASLTTALAFASLVFTDIPMIGHMGVQVALGVTSAFLLTVLLFPLCARWLSRDAGPGERLGAFAEGLQRAVVRRAPTVVAGFALLFVLGGLGASRTRVNAPLLADLEREHPIRQTNDLLAARLGGVIPLDVMIPPPPGQPSIAAYRGERLEKVEALTERLRALDGVLWATSAVDTLRRMAPLLQRLPEDEVPSLLPTALLLAHEQVRPWIDDESDTLRVRLRLRDLDTEGAFALFREIERACAEELGEPVRLTGQGYLAQVANRAIVTQFRTGFLVALLGVALALLVAFRDPRLALISLLPNLFPVVVVAGLMGALGIELRYTSALVLTVVFGLAVDDTIHMIAQWRRLQRDPDPLATTCRVAGPGLVLTSLLLAGGFGVLAFSAFLPLRVMGGLLVATAVLALAADLILLPALLRLLVPPRDSPAA